MATATPVRHQITTADIVTPGPTVRVVSIFAGNRVILENGTDDYHVNGGIKGRTGGKYLKFTNNSCELPDTPEWRDAFESSPYFGTQIFYADDLKAAAQGIPLGAQGIQVVDGVRAAGSGPVAAPLPGWDEMGPRELRPLIQSGQVGQPSAALMYEMTHRKREQVMTALGQAIARDSGQPVESDPLPPAAEHSAPLPSEGVV